METATQPLVVRVSISEYEQKYTVEDAHIIYKLPRSNMEYYVRTNEQDCLDFYEAKITFLCKSHANWTDKL